MKNIFVLGCLFIFPSIFFAQVGVNTSGSSPDNSAMLDVQSTDKGMLIPRMTTAQRTTIASPATGLLVFDNTTASFWFYNGSTWEDLSASVSDKIADADNDTKIQVEESADEDVIRFDMAGLEYFRMEDYRLATLNSGNSVVIGKDAGGGSNIGAVQYNVAVGENAMKDNANSSTGDGNTAIGYDVLRNNTTGNENVAIGRGVLRFNSTGSSNTAIGAYAGDLIFSGSNNNSFFGYKSGKFSSGSNNVFLGSGSGSNISGSNMLYIENSDSSSPLIYGEFDNDLLRINGTLNINNAFSFPATDGIANQILQTDGSGNLSWNDKTIDTDTDDQTIDVLNLNGTNLEISLSDDGEATKTLDLSSLNSTQTIITDTDNDTKIQVEETADDDVIRFDMAGTEFFRMNNGRFEVLNTGHSIFIGENAGSNDDLTDNANIFIGTNSGSSVTNQVQNAAIGTSSLRYMNNGFGNTAFGHEAGLYVDSGSNNTFIGRLSGRGSANHSKNNNTFLGAQSGESSEASNNIYLGFQSGQNNIVGTRNLFIGNQSGQNELGSDKLYIDNSNTATPLIYGEFDNDLLRVNGTLNINNAFSFPTTDGTANQVLQTDGSGNATWKTNTGAVQNQITDADNNTKIQVEETANEDIIRFDIVGEESLLLAPSLLQLKGDDPQISFYDDDNGLNVLRQAAIKTYLAGGEVTVPAVDASSHKMQFLVSDNTTNGMTEVLTLSGDGSVNINNSYTLPLIDGTTNQVMATDGSGTLTWEDVSTDVIRDADGDTKIQVEKSVNDDKIRFDIAGTERFRFSVTAGGAALFEVPNNGGSTFFGQNAGSSILNSGENTYIGTGAGNKSETGDSNTFLGNNAGTNNVSGSENVMLGAHSGASNLGSNNVFIGFNAGKNVTGSQQLYIANSGTSSPLIYGEFDNKLLRIGGELQVNGDLNISGETTIGANGSPLISVIKYSKIVDLPNIDGNGVYHATINIPNTIIGSTVYVSPSLQLSGSLLIGCARVPSNGVVEITFLNEGNNAQDMPNMFLYITIIR